MSVLCMFAQLCFMCGYTDNDNDDDEDSWETGRRTVDIGVTILD